MENKVLTLQEKMVKIRSEIPALVKRAYSEDVSYDFTKIDDVFRYLTPAMNRWKVNLDIVSESASKKNDKGDTVYLEFLAYCQMWLYEANLELKWTNAENPEDVISVTIHAIGTHEMPEKAKGSAWTYSLKYYLLDKYCIDQGGEDPDMRDFPPDTYDGDQTQYDDGESTESSFINEDSEDVSGSTAEPDTGKEGDPEEPDNELSEEPGVESDEEFGQAEDESQEVGSPEDVSEADGELGQAENGTELLTEESGPALAADTKETGKNEAGIGETTGKTGNNRPAPSRHIMPENGKMVNLPGGVSPEPAAAMSVEEARNIVCTFGIYKNRCLGELLEDGEEGIQNLQWLAFNYKGKVESIRQGARLLLNTLQAA